jgi:predicted membrane protein (TIGR00267 family)
MAAVMVALVDGMSPFIASVLVLSPFFLAAMFPQLSWAYYASFSMALLTLFGLGLFLGRISRENLVLSGVKTVVAGVVCMGLSYLLE